MIDYGLITGADGRHARRAVARARLAGRLVRRRRTVADGQCQAAAGGQPHGIPRGYPPIGGQPSWS